MTALVLAILLASLLGSMHCAGMCGAFLAIAISDSSAPAWRLQSAYHLGRLFTYLTFGALAGLLGATIDLAGALTGMHRAATALAAFTLIVFGSLSLLRALGLRTARTPIPAFIHRLSERAHRAAMTLPATSRALSIGLLTSLLPCGWLYAFVLVAAGSASITLGPVIMFVFWLGTLPLLVSIGAGLRLLTGPLARKAPLIASIALIVVGATSLLSRSSPLTALDSRLTALRTDKPEAQPLSELTAKTQLIQSTAADSGAHCHNAPSPAQSTPASSHSTNSELASTPRSHR